MQPSITDQPMTPPANPTPQLSLKSYVIFGALIAIIFFGTFGVWAAVAPLESAAIAPGVVHVGSKRKTIQHLEGGIIKEILVREGDTVNAGDPLIELQSTRGNADLQITQTRLSEERARVARLHAERDLANNISWENFRNRYSDKELTDRMMQAQNSEFRARRDTLNNQKAILQQRMEQINAERSGVRGEVRSLNRQTELLQDELESMERLLEKGFAGKQRVRELQRRVVEVNGQRSQNLAAISRIEQSVTETELQIADLEANRLEAVLQELQEVQAAIRELEEREIVLTDVVSRTNILAPLGGVVVGLRVFTQGGVIAPGEPLLDIVPSEEGFVIEARVDPVDIDIVRPGLSARVRFTSFNQRSTVPSEASILTISADHLTDERSGASYFLARVALDEEAIELLDQPVTPGMPAEVLILTGERTPLEYFISPIIRSFERAFRES